MAEREILETSFKDANSGDRRLVLLSGEPGIGKTTLASSFALAATTRGASVAYGRCDDDLFVPYQPWVEALGYLVEHATEDVVRDHVDACGAILGRVVPRLWRRTTSHTAPAGTGSDESDRMLLLTAIVDFLDRVSRQQPLVMILDDLHWADAASVQVLRHVVTANRSLRVLLIGTFRDSDVGAEDALAQALATLHRETGVHRVPLRGFSDDDLLRFLEVTAGHDLGADGMALRDTLLTETDGNPFFVGEMLRHLSETGALYQDTTGRWVASESLRDVGLPVSIREVVERRVLGLGADCHRVLTVGSVIGRDFDLDLLERVAEVESDRLIDLCDLAVAARVVRELPGGGYTFSHALIERTLYDGVSTNRRARLHRAVAEALEDLHGSQPGPHSGQLAHHWASAVRPTDVSKAVEHAQLAGDQALATLAPHEATGWYQRALDLLGTVGEPDPGLLVRIQLGLGTAQRQAGIAGFRETLLDAGRLADRNDDVGILVGAVLANTRGWESSIGAVDTDRIDLIERALERLDDEHHADRARLLAQSCMEQTYTGSLESRLAVAADAVAAARTSGNDAALAGTLLRVCRAVFAPMTLDQRTEWSTEACQLSGSLPDPTVRFFSHSVRFQCALEHADRSELHAQFTAMTAISERLPDPGLRWVSMFYEVVVAVVAGDLDEAERLADAALTLGLDSGQPDAVTIYGPQLINIRGRQGRLGELHALIDQAAAENPGLPAFQAALAAACVDIGDHDRARAILDRARDDGFSAPENPNWSSLHLYWTDLAVHFGDRPAAEILRARIAPYPGYLTTSSLDVSPVLGHYTGKLEHLLGRYDDADESFRRADSIHRRLESPPLIAMTQSAWAALLADRARPGDRDHARVLVTDALAVAEAFGYGTVERDARALLRTLDTVDR